MNEYWKRTRSLKCVIISALRLRVDLLRPLITYSSIVKTPKMLEPIMSTLNDKQIVLASSSPRRQEILKSMGLKFEVIPSLYEENLNPELFETPGEFVIATAENKVAELDSRLQNRSDKIDLIIGADTIVYYNKKIYGKPKSTDEAVRFLSTLSGNTHQVFTGVSIWAGEKRVTFSECTKVTFGNLPKGVIESYVASGEPMDKAGGYGIQGKAASLIAAIEGDYFNVVGLPLHRLCTTLLTIYQDQQ